MNTRAFGELLTASAFYGTTSNDLNTTSIGRAHSITTAFSLESMKLVAEVVVKLPRLAKLRLTTDTKLTQWSQNSRDLSRPSSVHDSFPCNRYIYGTPTKRNKPLGRGSTTTNTCQQPIINLFANKEGDTSKSLYTERRPVKSTNTFSKDDKSRKLHWNLASKSNS